jgi:hypothetical protein
VNISSYYLVSAEEAIALAANLEAGVASEVTLLGNERCRVLVKAINFGVLKVN